MSNENESLSWYQLRNYTLWVFSTSGFDPVNYYHSLKKKMIITNIWIYQRNDNSNDLIFIFSSPSRKDVRVVSRTNELVYPKYFFNYVSNIYLKQKEMVDSSLYTLIFEEFKEEINSFDNVSKENKKLNHVEAYSKLKTFSEKLKYIEDYGLQDQLYFLLKNVEIFSTLKFQAAKENVSLQIDKFKDNQITLTTSLVLHVLDTGDTSNLELIKEMTEPRNDSFIRDIILAHRADKFKGEEWGKTSFFFKHFVFKLKLKASSYWKDKANRVLTETYPFFCNSEKEIWEDLYKNSIENSRKKGKNHS